MVEFFAVFNEGRIGICVLQHCVGVASIYRFLAGFFSNSIVSQVTLTLFVFISCKLYYK